jgi:hypothetical protein
MKGILLFTVLALLAITGCRQEAKPVLSEMDMVPVVYDLMLAEEYGQMLKLKDSTLSLDQLRAEKYQQVFGLHKTTHADFASSYKYYLGHPDEMKTIIDSVDARANRNRLELMRSNRNGPAERPAIRPAAKPIDKVKLLPGRN